MLDEKDIQVIADLVMSSEKRIAVRIEKRVEKSENLLLGELDRVQSYLEKKIESVQKNLEELQQYYRITKLENDNTALLLKMIEELSKRVAELEKRTA